MRKLLFRNFRAVYRLSHWFNRHFTTAGKLAVSALVLAGVFGFDIRQTLAYQIFALLFAMLLVAMLASLRFRPRLEARRTLPRYATAGKTLRYRVTVYNRGKQPQVDLGLRDTLASRLPDFDEFTQVRSSDEQHRNAFDRYVGYHRWVWWINHFRGGLITPQAIPPLAAGDSIDVEFQLQPLRRGYLHFTTLQFTRPDPFGLFLALFGVPARQSLLVLPPVYPMAPLPMTGSRSLQRGGVSLSSSIGDSEEFVSLREYRAGDSLRHIHWRSWARLGTPVVKQYQDEFFVRHALVLDTFIEQVSTQVFEEAVSVAASCVQALTGPDNLLDLMFVGDQAYQFTSGRGLSSNEHLLEILACVTPCVGQSFDSIEHLLIGHAGTFSSCICVMLAWDPPRQRIVDLLRQRGVPVTVLLVRDSEPTATYESTPTDAPAGTTALITLTAGDIAAGLADLTG